tara:strand:+ start:614 stop:1246 length:633 start_codon:yes stop_codon:yes gene_type:complete
MAFALVESGSITKLMNGNKGIKIGDNQYPSSFFTAIYSEAERNAVGVYTIEIDNTNYKDTEWYVNTDLTYSYDSSANKVKGAYGTATAKPHADVTYTSQDKTDGLIPVDKDVGDVKSRGLKYNLIQGVKSEARAILGETDWYVVRKADTSEAVPTNIATHRAAVRTKQAEMETSITNAADTAALQTLYTYTYNSETKVTSRPIGELPTLE